MVITTPLALVLLGALPLVWWLGFPRVRYRRVRDSISLALRTVIVLLLVLALSGAQAVQSADRLAVVFLVDASDSMGRRAQEDALAYIRESLQGMAADDEVGVVLFGANALVERTMAAVRELPNVRSTPITSNTDLAEAIRLGLAMFPDDAAKRIVILSDGRATVGDTMAMAQMAAAAGVEISYVPFTREPGAEVQLTNFQVPETVGAQQEFDLSVTIESTQDTIATVTVLATGTIVHREDVELRAGTNNYTLALTSDTTGFRDFVVQVEPQTGDVFYQNNTLAGFSRVVGPPTVLVVSQEGESDEDARYLIPALQEAGLEVDIASPTNLPLGMGALAQYDSIILVNIPASALGNRRMQLIENYVKDLGGGLVMIGGRESFGPGGYFQTPIEDALPVEMRLRDQQRLPQLTIAYVVDTSGSMSMVGPSGVQNVDLAKEAIIRSIDFLQPIDRAAVMSFTASAAYVAPFQNVEDRTALQQLVGTLRADGGTDILAGMNAIARDIVNEPSQYKHIILLTDGGADPTGLVELTSRLYNDHGVTTTTIGIGPINTMPPFLQQMAQAGGGNYHAVEVIEHIPLIFAQETVLATRSYIIEGDLFPSLTARSPIMDGITALPAVRGYIATTPRQTGTVILRTPDENADPILAAWQYGLGRSVAFTSDATARWGANWVSWDHYARFWSQAVRWTITEQAEGNIETRVVMENEQARLIVDARDDNGNFLNGLDLQASLVSPDPERGGQIIQLQQVAPGRYEAIFTPDAEGAYFMQVIGDGVVVADGAEQPIEVNQRAGWVMNYSAEYDVNFALLDGTLLLRDLAQLTGGRSLVGEPQLVFNHNLTIASASTPLAPLLLLIALLLLPFDIAVRRLVVTRSDVVRLRNFIFPQRDTARERVERINTLMGAKQRARAQTDSDKPEDAPEPTGGAPKQAAEPSPRGTIGALKRSREQSAAPPTVSASPTTGMPKSSAPKAADAPKAEAPPEEGGSTASRLLKRKRRDGE
jgi:uncharacterized membrane protein